jgi:hypothetical protein
VLVGIADSLLSKIASTLATQARRWIRGGVGAKPWARMATREITRVWLPEVRGWAPGTAGVPCPDHGYAVPGLRVCRARTAGVPCPDCGYAVPGLRVCHAQTAGMPCPDCGCGVRELRA